MTFLKKLRTQLNRMKSREDGTSAIEFGLFTPILFFSLLATIDIGMAINERILMDQALRAGAEQAMFDPGQTAVEGVVQSAARIGFKVDGSGGALGEMTVNVTEYCTCPDAPTTAISCSTACSVADSYKYYTIAGSKTYQSVIIPDITFNSSLKVQVR